MPGQSLSGGALIAALSSVAAYQDSRAFRAVKPQLPGSSLELGRYGGVNEDFVLVDGWGECKAEGSQETVEGVGKALV
jgi:hypothetical protein